MKNYVRAFGQAVIVVLAIGALGAPTASAEFTSSVDNTALNGPTTQIVTPEFLFSEATVKCTNITFDNTTTGISQSEITAEPTYSGCAYTDLNTVAASIDMNGCHYLFTASGSLHIKCPAGKEIKITAFFSGAFQECLTIPEQTPTTAGIDYTNGRNPSTGAMDIEILSTVEGITYHRVGPCKKSEESKNEKNDGRYSFRGPIAGESNVGSPLDLTVSEGVFTSESASTILTTVNEEPTAQTFTTNSGAELKCRQLSFQNTSIGTSQEEFAAEPIFSQCRFVEGFVIREVLIDTNGCQYLFTSEGGATMHITCPEGKAINITEFIAGAFRECMVIPPQTPTSPAVDYHNGTNVFGRMNFEIEFTLSGITYERIAFCKKASENEKDDTMVEGTIELNGENEKTGEPVEVTVS
jgi:phage FluMu protein Com